MAGPPEPIHLACPWCSGPPPAGPFVAMRLMDKVNEKSPTGMPLYRYACTNGCGYEEHNLRFLPRTKGRGRT